jgi:hypothetical protein
MATTGNGPTRGKLAGEDLSSSQYKAVKLVNDEVILITAITDKMYGVLQNAPIDGQEATIITDGETKIVASAALAVDVIVGPSTAAKAQTAVTTQFPIGRITSSSAADDDIAVMEIIKSGVAVPA